MFLRWRIWSNKLRLLIERPNKPISLSEWTLEWNMPIDSVQVHEMLSILLSSLVATWMTSWVVKMIEAAVRLILEQNTKVECCLLAALGTSTGCPRTGIFPPSQLKSWSSLLTTSRWSIWITKLLNTSKSSPLDLTFNLKRPKKLYKMHCKAKQQRMRDSPKRLITWSLNWTAKRTRRRSWSS